MNDINFLNLSLIDENEVDEKVSIIVPCWNLVYQTKDCLEALARYVDVPFEVVVVNNNSTDGSKEYLDKEAENILKVNPLFKGYVAIHNNTNKYLSGAINIGVKNSTGDYISIIANDIIIPRNMYKFLINRLKEDKSIGAIGPWFTEDQRALTLHSNRLDSISLFLVGINDRDFKIDNNWHFSVCHIMRRDAWNIIGGWDENLKTHCNDNDWGIRLELAGFKAVTYHRFVCYHQYGSLGRKQIPQESEVAKKDLEYFMRKWGKRPDDKQPVSVIQKDIQERAKLGNYNSI